MSTPQPAGPRRPSTGRGPPMPPPGIPVKAGAFNTGHTAGHPAHSGHRGSTQHQHQQQQQVHSSSHHPQYSYSSYSSHRHPPHPQQQTRPQQPQQRMSMPPPQSRPYQPTRQSSALRSPALSSSSDDSSLKESTRYNARSTMPTRQVSATLGWDDMKSPREPDLVTPKQQYSPHVGIRDDVEIQFDTLLDSLQVPDSVRLKFNTVSQDVKSSILTSTMTSNPAILASLGLPVPKEQQPKIKKRMSTPLLRKAKSSSSLESPGSSPQVGKTYAVNGDAFTIVASPLSSPNPGVMMPPSPHRGQSMDMVRPHRMSTGPRPLSFFGASSSSGSIPTFGKTSAKGLGIAMGEQPDAFVEWLSAYKGTDLRMDVGRCKKLRMLLRHESTHWVATFIEMGGYKLVLARMQDLLDVEWREEQHDDQMLYELLRCVKALSTSDVGKDALRSSFPAPFQALSTLLFSEKKPGDLPSRQIIVELWMFLFDLFPPVSKRSSSSRPSSVRFDHPPTPMVDIVSTIRGLLVPDLPDPTKEHHEFITIAHRPRVFRAWVQELSDICRDYFWIMCHGSNTLWDVDEVDETLVEKPVAPGGATGGVEFEAMNYATTHFKLLNALCANTALEDRRKAGQLHEDLMSSGMDRILVTMRKASTTYYPALHLELARYVALLRAASPSARLPHLIDKMVGPPPEAVRKRGYGEETQWLGMPVALPTGGQRRGAWDLQV